MTFAVPQALFLLFLLVPLALLALWAFRRKRREIRAFLAPAAEEKNVVRGGREIDFFKTLLLLAALACFILALARPQWGEYFESRDVKGLEIIFLLDTSNSMKAEDLPPNRLDTAKQLIGKLVDNLKTDYVALINFAGVAYMQCPLTLDYDAFKLLTDSSAVSPPEEQGTDFSTAFALAQRTFRHLKGESNLLVLITDGEDLEKRWEKALGELKKQRVTIFTVGIGIPGGAPIPIRDEAGNVKEWKRDNQGQVVKSRLDEETLLDIARQTGGRYFRLAEISGINTFRDILKAFERQTLDRKMKRRRIERFHYPLALGLLLLVLEMILSDRKIQWRKKTS